MKTLATIIIAAALNSCGGTFAYQSPIGPISYTTPRLIQPPTVAVHEQK